MCFINFNRIMAEIKTEKTSKEATLKTKETTVVIDNGEIGTVEDMEVDGVKPNETHRVQIDVETNQNPSRKEPTSSSTGIVL